MAFQFPWTNLHELNLDWFLSKFKQFTNNYLATTATAESVPNGTPPSVTVTGGELDDDTDIVDPFTFNFKIPAGAQGEQGVPGVPGQDGFSPVATVTKSGSVATITITDANGTTTATISDGTVNIDQLNTKAPAIYPTISGSIAHFTDGADNLPMSELIAGIAPSQSGSGNPAPDNIRPISGWNGANVIQTTENIADKNIFDINKPSWSTAQYWIGLSENVDGTYTLTRPLGWGGHGWVYIGTYPAGTYTVSFDLKSTASVTCGAVMKAYYTKTWVTNAQIDRSGMTTTGRKSLPTLTTTALCDFWLAVGPYSDNGAQVISGDYQVEVGTNATSYKSYQSNTIAIDWTSVAGTVYGGTLNVGTGVLTVTHALFDMGDASLFTEDSNRPGIFRFSIPGRKNTTYITACSAYKIFNNLSTSEDRYITGYWAYGGGVVFFRDSSMAGYTSAQVKTAVSGYMLTYELDTPLTYQLTPQQIFNTLYGVNNVWSDTGDSTVTYTADTMLYIQNLTQPTEDDMISNTAIANGKFFMIGNNLYRATTAIASGSQIIPGTNATPMSLADALNLL